MSQGADLHAVDCIGWNALHFASQCGDVPTMSLLLDKGLDIKKKTHDGRTTLMIATRNGNEAAVDFLFAKGRYNNHYTQASYNKNVKWSTPFLKHLFLFL